MTHSQKELAAAVHTQPVARKGLILNSKEVNWLKKNKNCFLKKRQKFFWPADGFYLLKEYCVFKDDDDDWGS